MIAKPKPHSSPSGNSGSSLVEQVKQAAQGQWNDLLQAAGLPADCLEHRGRPCPKCGGEDRYNAASDVNDTGAVFCRHCFNKSSAVRPGDGIATVAWQMGTGNREALLWLADRLGLTHASDPAQSASGEKDILHAVCRNKKIPVDALRQFGARNATRGRQRDPVARVDTYNERGHVHSYFDLWPGGKGACKYGKGNAGMFFPSRLPKPDEQWVLVEGVKDAAALVGLGFNAAGMPTSKLAAKYAPLFTDSHVVIVPDLDLAGMRGADQTAGHLLGTAATVRVARLPGEVSDKQGCDVRDVLQKPDGESLVRGAIDRAVPWRPSRESHQDDTRPEVLVTMEEARVADEVVRTLGRLGWDSPWINDEQQAERVRVFVRGGLLVHAVESDDFDSDGRLDLRELPPCLIRERITQACSLVIQREADDDTEVVPTRPPSWLVDAIYRRGTYRGAIKPLAGIVQSPTIRVDGSILQDPGYDSKTGLIFRPSVAFPAVPEEPTRSDALSAILELQEVLADFPIYEPADASAWVSMVLSMIGRSCIDGYVPLFVVTANVRGAGKSLLVDAATLIAYGHPASRKVFTREEAEMRKVITAVAIAGTPSVLFDNLDVQLGGAALDAAITSSTWSDRVLGQSRMTGDLPMRTVWAATGNNVAFGSDIGRRVLPIRLQSPHETPEARTGFQHPELLSWIEAERPRLAVAALTILRAYFVAGCPEQPEGDWGSFERWSAVIRGAIVWAGSEDPMPTRGTALEGDDTASLLGKIITGIEAADFRGEGITTRDIQRKTFGSESGETEHETLAEAVSEICGEKFNGRVLGRRLRGFVGRVWQGRYLEGHSAHGGVVRWRVRDASGGFGGFGGLSTTQKNENAVCLHSDEEVLERETVCEHTMLDACENTTLDACEHMTFDVCKHTTLESERAETNPPNPPNQPVEELLSPGDHQSPNRRVVEI